MKKNVAALVLAIFGAVFGLIGGILWSACANFVSELQQATDGGNSGTIYLVCFIVLGIGGAVLALVGGIQAYNYKKGALVLTLIGLLFEVGCLIASCVSISGFSFVLSLCTIVSIILLIVAVVFAAKKPTEQQTEQNNS